jgi:hypothetical protein
MRQVNNASKVVTMQIAGRNVPVDQSMISTEAPIVDDGSTGAQIETGERKIKPQRFGTKRKTITQDEPKQQPKKKESILTPGLKLKKDKKDDEVDTTEEIKGTTTQPNPGSGGIRGSRGAPRNTVKVDEQKQEAMIEGDDAQVMQADFRLDTVNKNYIINQWSKKYKTETKVVDGKIVPMTESEIRNQKNRVNRDLLFRSVKIPEEAESQITQVAEVFAGQNNFTEDNIMEMLGAVGFFESKYQTKIQKNKGPARSYWQIEPKTAKDILKQNMQASNPILGQKFNDLFKDKYADQIGNSTALEYFASLNDKQLSNLLENDGLFAAAMAGFKVVTTFDPFNSKGA